MKHATEIVGAFDAKTRLSELLARAAQGESFVITKHGRPMARLVPERTDQADRISAAAENLLRFRGELVGLTQDQIRDDRHAGHRYP